MSLLIIGASTAECASPVADLRYALDVMEENSHLGLDNETASKVRNILVRQIEDARADLSSCPTNPVRFPVQTKTYA